jgi:ABC-type antimicrobial peptide transport system permease subunit
MRSLTVNSVTFILFTPFGMVLLGGAIILVVVVIVILILGKRQKIPEVKESYTST